MISPALRTSRGIPVDRYDPNMKLYLPGLPGVGSTIYDYSLSANHGAITGALWKSIGGIWYLDFDGTDDYVTIGDTTTFKFLHGANDTTGFKWTIAFWMSLPTPEPDTIWGLLGTALWSPGVIGITIGYDDRSGSSKSRDMTLHIEQGTAYLLQFDTNNNLYPNDSLWHRIVFTYDQSLVDTNMNFYIDAVSKATANKTANAASTANSGHALIYGARETATQNADVNMALLEIIDGTVWSLASVQKDYQQTKQFFGV